MAWFVGVDLGQASDWTAVACVEGVAITTDTWEMRTMIDPFGARVREAVRVRHPEYHLRHLERPALGTSYVDIVARVKALLSRPDLAGATLIVDATGVGRAVVDMMSAAGLRPVRVQIHGGSEVSHGTGGIGVPKRDLAGVIQAALARRRLKVPIGLPLARQLKSEMLAFRVKISASGHDTYEALREGDHDDLILAVAMAVWYAERVGGGIERWAPDGRPPAAAGSQEWCEARRKEMQDVIMRRAKSGARSREDRRG